MQGYQDDIELWLKHHEERLQQLVRETRLGADTVQLIALLVLTGHSDEKIYTELGAHIVSLDGQHSPLAGAPNAIEAIRRLAADT